MCTCNAECRVENAASRLHLISRMTGTIWRRVWCVALLLLPDLAVGLCPVQCTCDEHVLMVSCTDATLDVVPIQLNPDVLAINLRYNKIAAVHFALGFYYNLRILDMSHNLITTLGNRNFGFQVNLVTLNLSSNFIVNLNKDTFKGLKSLRVLDLSRNNVESLEGGAFSSLPNLVELLIAENKIVDIGHYVFEKLIALAVLKLDRNLLLDIPTACLRYLENLEYLGLGGNLIASVEENKSLVLHNLRTLVLSANVIVQIDRAAFSGLTPLEYLDLSDNNLTAIPTESLSKLKNLTYLDLSGNSFYQIKPVAFQSLFKLEEVKLSKLENLYKIDVRAFVDNIKLESIEMDGNKMLTVLPWRLFHGNPLVTELSIRYNGLTSLDASHFPLDQLHYLSLGGNPIHCNCSLFWLWLLGRQQEEAGTNNTSVSQIKPLLDIDSILCATPQEWKGMKLSNVPESAVQCDNSLLAILLVGVAVTLLAIVICVLFIVRCRTREEQIVERMDPPHLMHQKGAVMMLLGQEDSLDNFVLRTNKELAHAMNEERQFPSMRELEHRQDPAMGLFNGPYPLRSSTNKPTHIVYV